MSNTIPAGGGLLGRAAMAQGWINPEQLQQAVEEQSASSATTPLGELLVEKGWLRPNQLQWLLINQANEKQESKSSARPGYSSSAISSASAASTASGAPGGTAVSTERQVSNDKTDYELDGLLAKAVAAGAGDFHVHSGAPMFARMHGELRPASSTAISEERVAQLLDPILTGEQRRSLREQGEVDFAYDLGSVGRFRANVYRHHRGLSGIFRHIPPRPPTLEALGLPSNLARFANFFQGIVLITGPAGSGKSSTLAALVELINAERNEHILTVEDPVEFVFESKLSTVNQRQVQRHTESFSSALRGALREDPDIIVIGELRDQETIGLALTAAETGHLVLGTMTTGNAIRTIERLIGAFPPKRQNQVRTMISESLRGVICQRLLARADGHGRVVAQELLLLDQAVANLIRDEKTFQIESVLQTGASRGLQSMDVAIEELVRTGVVDRETARLVAEDPTKFEEKPSTASRPES